MMNQSESTTKLAEAKQYLREAVESLEDDAIVDFKNSVLMKIKNKSERKKQENDFDENFIKSYIEEKLNHLKT